MGIAEDLIIIIIAGLTAGLTANKLRIPPIIGYIIAGIIIGPGTGGITVSDIPRIELLAEIGVALLLFSIGLDLSFRELKPVKAIALIGTPIQIIILIAAGLLIGRYMGLSLTDSIVFGMVISLSSTMVVIKTLMSRGLTGTLSSRVMIGILIVQDLAAIPLMLIIPNLGSLSDNYLKLVFIFAKALVILGGIVFIGVRIIPRFLKVVVKLNSRELFLITITAIGLGVGYLTHMFGLSLAFGAFVAGMVINESDYSHQALNDIIPLRDIFGLVFFTSIGMLLDMSFIFNNLMTVFALVFVVILVKFITFSGLSLAFKYYNIIPLAAGFGLAQVGEFSFVLARGALKSGIINADFYSLLLSVSIITMILSPFLSLLPSPVYSLRKKWFRHEQVHSVNVPSGGLENHIVIAGGGRVGSQIATILKKTGFSFIIVEQDFRRFEKAKKSGFPVIYGDASQEPVLGATKIEKAGILIVTIPFLSSADEIIRRSLKYNPDIKIIVRADDMEHADALSKMDIFEVVQPEFEASLEIIRQSLMILEVPLSEIFSLTDTVRRENYSRNTIKNIKQSSLNKIRETPFLLEMSWVKVMKESRAAGKSIAELQIRSRTGVSVVGVLRNSALVPNPGPEFVFGEGDYAAVIGMPEDKQKFISLINAG